MNTPNKETIDIEIAQNNDEDEIEMSPQLAAPPLSSSSSQDVVVPESATVDIVVTTCNQETEHLVAMVDLDTDNDNNDDHYTQCHQRTMSPPPKDNIQTTTTPTQINIPDEITSEVARTVEKQIAKEAESETSAVVVTTFAIPFTPIDIKGSSSSVNTGSLRRKKRLTCSGGGKAKDGGGYEAVADSSRTKSCRRRLVTDQHDDGAAMTTNIKTSLSMTSLPPDDDKQESRNVIKAQLRVDRPYNSLKKNTERNSGAGIVNMFVANNGFGGSSIASSIGSNSRASATGAVTATTPNKYHRYSWGSGHSYSSSSLHSSATLGLGSGKDDLWAVIQTNYNYIMDTNLLDTCKEARCEIEGVASVLESPIEGCFKMLDGVQRNESFCEDPKMLRKWLREMEHKLDGAPSLTEATLFSISELQYRLAEHSVIYNEIISYARVVNACIRAASEKEQQQRREQEQQQQSSPVSNSSSSAVADTSLSSLSTDDTLIDAASSASESLKTPISTGGSGATDSGLNTTTSSIATLATPAVPAPAIDTPLTSGNNTTAISNSSVTTKKDNSVEGNLERLQNRYHLLYLKAFEVQLWLDGLLRKRSSSVNTLNDVDDVNDDDEEEVDDSSEYCNDDNADVDVVDGATEDDLDDVASDLESGVGILKQKRKRSSKNNTIYNIEDHSLILGPSNDHKANCEDCDYEGEDEDDSPQSKIAGRKHQFNFIAVLRNGGVNNGGNTFGVKTTLTDFEADSESSDFEISKYNLRRYRKQQQQYMELLETTTATTSSNNSTKVAAQNPFSVSPDIDDKNETLLNNSDRDNGKYHSNNLIIHAATSLTVKSKMGKQPVTGASNATPLQLPSSPTITTTTPPSTLTATTATQTQLEQQQALQILHNNKQSVVMPSKHKTIAIISPNSHNNTNHNNMNNKSPSLLRKHRQQQQQQQQQQQRHIDISKFNRSNRKSKNCAIFYFKHLDTDHETISGGDGAGGGVGGGDGDAGDNGGHLSSSASHTSDLLKFVEASSDDDEGWLYSSSPAVAALQTTTAGIVGFTNSQNDNTNTRGCNNNNSNNNISSITIDGLQSATVSSSNSNTTHSDDSDKENKEALVILASATSSVASIPTNQWSSPQIATISGIHLAVAATTHTSASATTIVVAETDKAEEDEAVADEDEEAAAITAQRQRNRTSVISSCSNSSSCNCCNNSSCSSYEMLTETTTSAQTTTTQIKQMHCQPAVAMATAATPTTESSEPEQQLHRTEMKIQINACHRRRPKGGNYYYQYNNKNTGNNNNSSNNNKNSSSSGGSGSGKNNHHQHNHNYKNSSNNNNNNDNSNSDDNGNNQQRHNNNSTNNNCNNNNNNSIMKNMQQQQLMQPIADTTDDGNAEKENNIAAKPSAANGDISCNYNNNKNNKLQPQMALSPGKRLPPRSPAKAAKPQKSNGASNCKTSKGKVVSHESIKQLVLEAEHLVRDEALKTPTKPQKHSHHQYVKLSSTVKKRDAAMPGPIKQRVQEWLEHQAANPAANVGGGAGVANQSQLSLVVPARADDCEASGEASETDSIPQPGSDSSEGFTDSIATCMQTSTNSYGTSTERIGGSAEPIIVGISTQTATTARLAYGSSNQSLNVKIIKRQQPRRKSERPWSVSCISQLTTDATQASTPLNVTKLSCDVQAGLASHSISESALDSISPGGRPRAATSASAVMQPTTQHHGSSLKRRKTRKKKLSNTAAYSAGKNTDSGSEEIAEMPKLLLKSSCESMSSSKCKTPSTEQTIVCHPTLASQHSPGARQQQQHFQFPASVAQTQSKQQQPQQQLQQLQQKTLNESDEEAQQQQLMKPNFRVGSYTTTYMAKEARLGSLAALATYMNEDEQQGEYTTGTEDHNSSFSETAWDNYQEKYNSENYSEGFDSDAARRLLEFGDDYRNFIDSQSDCCSSLSAANNLDSLSPPRMDSLQQQQQQQQTQQHLNDLPVPVDHSKRRRALELEYERRRKPMDVRRKSCQDCSDNHQASSGVHYHHRNHQHHHNHPTLSLSASAIATTSKNGSRSSNAVDKFNFSHNKHNDISPPSSSTSHKFEFGHAVSHSAQSLMMRRTSESDTSTRRRKGDERRRSSRNLEKSAKLKAAAAATAGISSSPCSSDDSDDEKEMRNLLQQSRNRLEDTRALKIRCHLLRPEDYSEIISTCRDNIHCLEAVIRGPPGTVLSAVCVNHTKDLLTAWEELFGWSENAAAARKMQEDMIILKHALNRLGNKSAFELLDNEPSIQIAIEALKNEKTQLQTYRTNMLRLNASVHSWLTRQEHKLQQALVEQQIRDAAARITEEMSTTGENQQVVEMSTEAQLGDEQGVKEAITAIKSEQLIQQQQIATATTTTTITTITVTDSNGEKVQEYTTTNVDTTNSGVSKATVSTGTTTTATTTASTGTQAAAVMVGGMSEKMLDLQILMNSENEFHKHLKDEVGNMYMAWDDADARINTQLEMLTSSLIAWRQLECGLSEFHLALGQDRGTLKGLEGALNKGQATPVELAQNVKLVAKLLSEKVNVSQEQLTAVQEHLDPNHILHFAKFTASNGSLSDSGISDGGTTSDGGLSERERRLSVLRRLAKQLESALAPGSDAMKSIAARMESAEAELKTLQNTCRDLIVRTAATHQNKKQQQQQQQLQGQQQQQQIIVANVGHDEDDMSIALKPNGYLKINGHAAGGWKKKGSSSSSEQQGSPSKRKNKRKQRRNSPGGGGGGIANIGNGAHRSLTLANSSAAGLSVAAADGGDDPSDDPTTMEFELDSSDDDGNKRTSNGWTWRIVRAAMPMQLALFTLWAYTTLMQPNCCDNLNTLSMSFTPQLRYIRGPPPI